jgi:micrococcal nuclease
MKKRTVFLIVAFVLCLQPLYAQDFFDAYVVKVLEGDTLLLKGGTTVRLMGIDTPQTRFPNQLFTELGEKALSVTKKMVEKKKVRLELVDPAARSGSDARKFAYVFVSGRMVNALLLKQGLAVISRSFPPDAQYADYFVRSQAQAVQAKAGIWQILSPQEKENTYAF